MGTKIDRIIDWFEKTDLDIDWAYHLGSLDDDDINSFYDVRSNLDDGGVFNVEIIGYGAAMEYLSENDYSLRESLEIAKEFGYEIDRLSSELLASLLASKDFESEFWELESEFDSFLMELEDELAEDEDDWEDEEDEDVDD